MKKLLLQLLLLILYTTALAQVDVIKKGWDTNIPNGCFCCNDQVYNLPKTPDITGPKTVCVCDKATFSIPKCDGAAISWAVVDNNGNAVNFTGNGSASITLQPPYPNNATSIKITVTIRCGRKEVTSTTTAALLSQTASFSGLMTFTGNNTWTVSATGVPGYFNYWRLAEITPSNTPHTAWGTQTPLPGGQVATTNFSWSGTLVPGKQYRLIHWIEKCPQHWDQNFPNCVSVAVQPIYAQQASSLAPNKGDKIEFSKLEKMQIIQPTPENSKNIRSGNK